VVPDEMVQFLLKFLLKQRILAEHHDFHWLLENSWQPNFIQVMLRSWNCKFWKSWSWSQVFYLWLCNPG